MKTVRAVIAMLLLFAGGVFLNVLLYAAAGNFLAKHFQMQQNIHALEDIHASDAAHSEAARVFQEKNALTDFLLLPIIACIIGIYAGVFRTRKAAVLALACLLPMFAFETYSQPIRAWSPQLDFRYFGVRVVGLLVAGIVAASVSKLSHRRAPEQES